MNREKEREAAVFHFKHLGGNSGNLQIKASTRRLEIGPEVSKKAATRLVVNRPERSEEPSGLNPLPTHLKERRKGTVRGRPRDRDEQDPERRS